MGINNKLGAHGEDLAVAHLLQSGLQVLDRNWRCAFGEIDVVARDGDVTAFVEVKTRRGLGWGHPTEAVTVGKQKRIRQLAALWLQRSRTRTPGRYPWTRVRFDVVSVLYDGGPNPVVEHRKGVF